MEGHPAEPCTGVQYPWLWMVSRLMGVHPATPTSMSSPDDSPVSLLKVGSIGVGV